MTTEQPRADIERTKVVKKFEVVTLLFDVTQVVVTNQEGNPPPHQPTPPPIVVSLQIDQMRN